MLDGILWLWFTLTGLALVFVVWDSIASAPTSWVQKLAWILVTAYTGPIGLFLYLLACRSPGRGLHDTFTKAHWKQSVNSEMHCLAGDATGIIFAAFVVSHFGLPNGVDLILEYVSAFVVGLFIFQALMMKGMYGDYATAVRKTFFAETVSMNMVMVGMIPAMVILMHRLPGGDDPYGPTFWFVMGMAAIAGGITAYPINSWLVRHHLKHGCMTLPGADGPAPELGHQSMEGIGDDMAGMDMGGASGVGGEDKPMEMGSLPLPKAVGIIVATAACLLVAAWITTFFAPIAFG